MAARCSRFLLLFLAAIAPLRALGNNHENPDSVTELLNRVGDAIIDPLIFILFATAFVVFLWGVLEFVMHLDDEEARRTGVRHMIWGIVGMVIMLGVQGIIALIGNTIGFIKEP